MILGVGIDVVDVERFAERLDRVPRLRHRLFTPLERDEPVDSLAARFAAKAAVAKDLGAPPGLSWQAAEIRRGPFGKPELFLSAAAAELAAKMGITSLHRSEAHTSELQSRGHIVCRLLLENKN